jgi:hypothetical protein
MKGSFIDSLEEYVLSECLKIMFPGCDIEIRAVAPVTSPDKKINISPDQNQFALSKEEK